MNEEIGELCEDFEARAKKLGYTLQGLALTNDREGRIQVNWNDKIKPSELNNACEGLALALCMLANGDKDLINDAISKAYIRTPPGREQFAHLVADAMGNAIKAGIEIGKQTLKELQAQAPELPSGDEPEKLEEAKE